MRHGIRIRRENETDVKPEITVIMKVSPRTLQTLRDNGTLAYTQICHKTYYKPGDVESIIRIVEERRKRAESMGRSI